MKKQLETLICAAQKEKALAHAAEQLSTSYEKKCGRGTYSSLFGSDIMVVNPPPPILPKISANHRWRDVEFFELNSLEFARQFTITSSHFYAEIKPIELLDCAWSKAKHLAPNLLGMIENFNRLSRIASTLVCSEPKLKQRVKVYAKLVEIASCFLELNNYDGAMAIISGLANSAVNRLKFTKDALPQKVVTEQQRIKELFDSTGSYKTYRAHISAATPPCIPFVGVYLTDLTFIEDGNQNTIDNMINVYKRSLVYEVVSQILQFQHQAFNLKLSP
eukprot:CAMPEP_0201555756 /NCGR_PEP_ID=MMETSP0173_2-20130828/51115_1 /ASSEMBLY_ACC=CAM_ASM_000268 /TAXON_ID=218659 /ORGANISM="Vexillifera sp., Strain DIVA3 564/2" /LENGTH=275 /DNA_ID=CAMNT_0047967705 /DNA_START=86 /DNA_END=910 /DNA_ORIENTATION=-